MASPISLRADHFASTPAAGQYAAESGADFHQASLLRTVTCQSARPDIDHRNVNFGQHQAILGWCVWLVSPNTTTCRRPATMKLGTDLRDPDPKSGFQVIANLRRMNVKLADG